MHKITIHDYTIARMRRAGAFTIDIETARLLYSPVSTQRNDLRDRIQLPDKTLASRAAKFLTLADEYARRRQFARDMAKPPYVMHTLSCTRQLKPSPFESGRNCLPGMERFRDQSAA